MDIVSQLDPRILAVVNQIQVVDYENTYVAILNNILGRNGRLSNQRYSRWRTACPYMASLTHWVLTGKVSSPGNPHVERTKHNAGGNTNDRMEVTPVFSNTLRATVRALFTFPEVQKNGEGTYMKQFVIVTPEFIYVCRVTWFYGVVSSFYVLKIYTYIYPGRRKVKGSLSNAPPPPPAPFPQCTGAVWGSILAH